MRQIYTMASLTVQFKNEHAVFEQKLELATIVVEQAEPIAWIWLFLSITNKVTHINNDLLARYF